MWAEPISHKQRLSIIVIALFFGLVVSQLISTLHVYFSNIDLYHHTESIIEAGYQPVPNQKILPLLKEVDSAFFGGLFLTLTVGSLLSLLSLSYGWIWNRIFNRKKWLLIPGVVIWMILLWCLNAKGFNPFPSVCFVLVPFVVFIVFIKLIQYHPKEDNLSPLFFMVSLVLLTLIWMTQIDKKLFIDFRDHMLLSNPIGIKINNYYYKYTLYPTEIFKSIRQKQIKTANLENFSDKRLVRQIKSRLIHYDYLPVKHQKYADVIVEKGNDKLILRQKNTRIMDIAIKAFLANPGTYLTRFSELADTKSFYRQFIFLSLIVGLPISLFIITYAGIRYILAWVMGLRWASIFSSILCFVIGLSLLIPFSLKRTGDYGKEDIPRLVASKNWYDRVEGYKTIYDKKFEITYFPAYGSGIHSPFIPERYWLAMVFSNSRNEKTYSDLKNMMDDSHPNVACKVFFALGKRGDRSLIPIFLDKLNDSEHWYVQSYIYSALRDLGWKQKKLN